MNSGSKDGNIAEALRGIMEVLLSDVCRIDLNLPLQTFGCVEYRRIVRNEVVRSLVNQRTHVIGSRHPNCR